jgi:transketolase
MIDLRLSKLAANTIRVLSAEAVQKAKSGHPGMPMGCADFAFTLWFKYMKHNPKNPKWLGRDRFILSAGHGSMLEYSLLHLFEYGLTIDEIKQFRQWGSKTPGHPEYNHTAGADITTGPLGSGFASAVGMSMANKYFAAKTGMDKSGLVDSKIFVMCGDGCMMEGATSEAASLAGHQKLENIICFYDDNSITIEGSTNLAFSENVGARFAAYNWRVINIADANDIEQCDKALAEAVISDGRPTLIIGKTKIGFGSPNKEGKSSAHGEPLGQEEVEATKKHLGMPEEPFFVMPEVKEYIDARVKSLISEAAEWDKKFQGFLDANPDKNELISKMLNRTVPENILEELLKVTPVGKPIASRASGGEVLQRAVALVPSLIGGAADLAPSTKTDIKGAPDFNPANRGGCNFHFGVRELAMGFAGNGMALYETIIPYTSTFFVFSDYMKPAMRLASIQGLHQIYVFTHDSFYVGEDGPTHEPIEQLVMLRSIPGFTVIRPAEAHEVAHAWAAALKAKGPVAILLTRQDLDPFTPEMAARVDVARGAYVLSDDEDFDIIMIATGSEVGLTLKAAELLRSKGVKVRVVSMPSQELFLKQDCDYQESVLPSFCINRISVEAGSTFGWHRFIGRDGLAIGMDTFGASAPFKVLAEKFGFTPEAVVETIKNYFGGGCSCGCSCK